MLLSKSCVAENANRIFCDIDGIYRRMPVYMWVLLWYAGYRFMVWLWASGGIQSVCFYENKCIKIRVRLCGRECGER